MKCKIKSRVDKDAQRRIHHQHGGYAPTSLFPPYKTNNHSCFDFGQKTPYAQHERICIEDGYHG